MVGHQAIADETHARRPLPGLAQQLDKGGVIAFLVKHSAAAVAPVEHVVAVAALGCAWAAWHTTDYRGLGREVKKIMYAVPFSSPALSSIRVNVMKNRRQKPCKNRQIAHVR